MKIVKISVGKEYKIGLPNYSNISARCDIAAEIGENEEVNWSELWDTVNRELRIQSDGIDPSWIISKEYTNFFKTVIKTNKGAYDPTGNQTRGENK